jgi:hypothetical protein
MPDIRIDNVVDFGSINLNHPAIRYVNIKNIGKEKGEFSLPEDKDFQFAPLSG